MSHQNYRSDLVKGDEFDGPDSGPIPPNERPWRHPAELAHETRTSFMRDAAPPPLSRRTTAVVATGSLVASVVLLALTVPQGVGNERPDTSDVPVAALAKGSSPDSHLVNRNGRDYGALPVGEGRFITSIGAVADMTSIQLRSLRSGDVFEMQVVARDERLGIAIVQTDTTAPDSPVVSSVLTSMPGAMVPEPGMRVVHPNDGTEVNCHPSISLSAPLDADAAPVTVESPVAGAALVTDAWGTPLGVIVDRPKGHWMISGGAVQDAIDVATVSTASVANES